MRRNKPPSKKSDVPEEDEVTPLEEGGVPPQQEEEENPQGSEPFQDAKIGRRRTEIELLQEGVHQHANWQHKGWQDSMRTRSQMKPRRSKRNIKDNEKERSKGLESMGGDPGGPHVHAEDIPWRG